MSTRSVRSTYETMGTRFQVRRPAARASRLLGLLAALGLGLGWAGQALAQVPRLSLQRITATSAEMRAYLTYVDPQGGPLLGKKPGDFQLLVDSAEFGAATSAIYFEAAREPLYVVAVVQTSAHMQPLLPAIAKGIGALGDAVAALPGSKLAIISYGKAVTKASGLGEVAAARSVLGKLSADADDEPAHAIEAVQEAVELLRAEPTTARKLVVLVSDGKDPSADLKPWRNAGSAALQAGVVISAVGPGAPGEWRAPRELSRRSMGIERPSQSGAELAAQLTALIEEIRKQYVVTWSRPPVTADKKEHTFQVVTTGGDKPIYSSIHNTNLDRLTPR